ncbi:MAG TPA: YciI family protein [Cyclobacteriaceae bacterium]|jgi:uncharacterized protein YciI|nr:YciI family protein [Cyclobacteriaceae bacterium]
MFIVDLQYVTALEKLDQHMTDHVRFLQKYYKLNVFLTSGRKVPRTGGIILAAAPSRKDLEDIMAEDPFCQHGLAKVTITEFLNSQMHPAFKKMMTGLN